MSPRVKSTVDQQGVNLTGLVFTRELGWVFRPQPEKDIGVDALVEVISESTPTGDWIALQIKSGAAYFRERTDAGIVFRGDTPHLQYWLSLPIPVLLILCSPKKSRCWWQPIDSERIEVTGKRWKTIVPGENRLGEKSAQPIQEFLKTWHSEGRRPGFPDEDELCVIFHLLGRCELVHRLNQFPYPPSARRQFQVPDLLAVFNVKGESIPVLIEVANFSAISILSFDSTYISSLNRYASSLGLPLLIAWKFLDFWVLFESRHLRAKGNRVAISFTEAMPETLLGLLAGDFSYSLTPGARFHMKIRKLKEVAAGFEGTVEEAYLINANGERHTGEGGIFQLFMSIEPQVQVEEDEIYAVQSFVIPEGAPSELAHRALATLLRAFGGTDPLDWRRLLLRKRFPFLFESPHQAAMNGLEAGFLQRKIDIRPRTKPAFVPSVGA